MGPEPPFVVLGESESGSTDGLAGEAAGEYVDIPHRSGVQFAHILEARNVRPVLCENTSTERVALAMPHQSHARSLKAKFESADA